MVTSHERKLPVNAVINDSAEADFCQFAREGARRRSISSWKRRETRCRAVVDSTPTSARPGVSDGPSSNASDGDIAAAAGHATTITHRNQSDLDARLFNSVALK